ncbi:MAG: type II toxin-antitoxin system RelE/ParE family toxin [bacterium]
MKTRYMPSFVRDLRKMRDLPVYDRVKTFAFDKVPHAVDLREIPNLAKIKKSLNAYRIRVGEYRIGILFEDDTVVFMRVLHRRDLYRFFP